MKNSQIQEEELNKIEQTFNAQLNQVQGNPKFDDLRNRTAQYLMLGKTLISEQYQNGIIAIANEHQQHTSPYTINILNGIELSQENLFDFSTVQEVNRHINDSLSKNNLANADFLIPVLATHIKPNLIYNDSISQAVKAEISASIAPTQGMVNKGELIIPRGGEINESTFQKLNSLKDQYEKNMMANRSRLLIFIGYFLLTSLIIGVFVLYLINFAPEIFNSTIKLISVFMWLIIYSYLVTAVESIDTLNTYLIPFCIVPIVIKTFYNARLALFTHIVVVLIASFISSQGYEFTFLTILAGIVVLLTDVNTRDWSRFFYAILFIFLTYGIGYFSLGLIQEGQLNEIDFSAYSWLVINVILTLLAYPLIPLLERFFGFTSSISLMELSDMNRPLLRKLALDAPGTLQHSLQVANLSEAAATAIGADALLVKVAALYHDVGKTQQPEFYIENQSGNNPHDHISDLDSAKIIIDHVNHGLEMAKKARLPKLITQFISSHHGTTRVEYFYRNYLKDHPNESVDEQIFRYPGPKPTTKEETILMLADSIEAACKSLKNPTEEDLTNLIDKIVSGKINSNQLSESTISFQELAVCKATFQQIMKSVHHVRIEYPEEQKKKAN